MTSPEQQAVYAAMSDEDIAEVGLQAAGAAFSNDCLNDLVAGDSLAISVGTIERGTWVELGRAHFGPSAADFDVNIDPVTGKLATAINYGMDSITAKWHYGDRLPEGPQSWTGAVYYIARVETADGWMERRFVGAASGVQGHIDQATTYSALTRMGAMWALKMLAIYGKAA